jgi:phage protein D
MTSTAAYTSTPSLSIGGQDSPAAVRNLLALSVEEDTLGLCSCEATFNNWGVAGSSPGYLYLDRRTFDFGTELRVRMGPGAGEEVFNGRISALQADYPSSSPASVTVCAEDRLQDFRMTRRTRTFEDSSTEDIASRLCSDHGLQPSIDLAGPSRRVVNQLNLSDLAFLRELARRDDGEVWLSGQELHLQRRPDREQGNLTLTYGGDLLTFTARADLAHQVTDLTVTGWSVADKAAIAETADSSALGSEVGGDTAASSIIGDAFAERHERLVVAEPLAADDARSQAKAAYLARARRFVCGGGTTGGSPTLRVGTRVTLAGLSGIFDGDYRVTMTRHHFELSHGYTTDFEVERAGIGAATGAGR